MYPIMAIIGITVAFIVYYYLAKKRNGMMIDDVFIYAALLLASMLMGGHLLFGVTMYRQFLSAINDVFRVSADVTFQRMLVIFGGSVFYGGLLGCLLTTHILRKHTKILYDDAFDLLAVLIPLFHGFGRIGCFLGGCCYGIVCDFGFASSTNEFVPEVVGIRRFPVQLTESLCNFILFFILLQMLRKDKLKDYLIFVYLYSYALIRFGLEFLRGDVNRGIMWGISTSQWFSLGIIMVCSVILILKKLKKPHSPLKSTHNEVKEIVTKDTAFHQ